MADPEKKKKKKKKPLDLNRRAMPKQLPEVRGHNFDEVALGYPAMLAIEEANRCIQCPKPKCVDKCPVEINIPGFIKAIAEGDFELGISIMKGKNCLPAVCGRVCPQEEQCEEVCVLVKKGEIPRARFRRRIHRVWSQHGSASGGVTRETEVGSQFEKEQTAIAGLSWFYGYVGYVTTVATCSTTVMKSKTTFN